MLMESPVVGISLDLGITIKPDLPRVGDTIDCESELVSEKSPCSGPVIGVACNGVVAVKWSDTIQILCMSWANIRAVGIERLVWKIPDGKSPYHELHSGHTP